MNVLSISLDEAYCAMFLLLEEMHNDSPDSGFLSFLLSSLQLIDLRRSLDPAMWFDWEDAAIAVEYGKIALPIEPEVLADLEIWRRWLIAVERVTKGGSDIQIWLDSKKNRESGNVSEQGYAGACYRLPSAEDAPDSGLSPLTAYNVMYAFLHSMYERTGGAFLHYLLKKIATSGSDALSPIRDPWE